MTTSHESNDASYFSPLAPLEPEASSGASLAARVYAERQPVVGVLLVHGLNGGRSDMAELETFLQDRGLITTNMLLPGHGGHIRDLITLGWEDWAEAVQQELRALKKRCDTVFIVGHSLGGALSLHVAAHEEVAGVVTMCAPIHMYPWLKPVIRLMKYFVPLLPLVRQDVHNPVARRQHRPDVYRWTPIRPLESMVQFLPQLRTELPLVTAPALIITSVHDHVVPARDGRAIYSLIGSQEKYLVTLYHSFHVIMKDHDSEEVFTKTAAFITSHASKAQPHAQVSSADQTA